jgi:hypothetical protein
MDVPSAFDRAIRYSVPRHQCSTFDRAVAGLPADFLELSSHWAGVWAQG